MCDLIDSVDLEYGEEPSERSDTELGTEFRKKARKTFSRLFLALSVYTLVANAIVLLAQLFVIFLFPKHAVAVLDNPYFSFGLQVLAMYIIAFPIYYLMTRKLLKNKGSSPTLNTENARKGIGGGELICLFFISYASMIVGSLISGLIVELLSGGLGASSENELSDFLSGAPIWLVVLVAVIIGPIIEELIFRKIFIDATECFGAKAAILVSGISFGVFHGNLHQMIYASVLGIIFGYIYVKTGKIIYTVCLHILLNFLGTVPTLLLGDALDRISNMPPDMTSGEAFSYLGDIIKLYGLVVMQYGLAITGVVIFIVCLVKKLFRVPKTTEFHLAKSIYTKSLFLNVGAILFILVCIAQIILSLI